ncbi:hypothetical protein M426DRAFT_27242 [Hypoxylon sp. CI-4A]|nr:hypothetical protein M426DRAFT_27242 [Hypoxylon sp. CI-4A]
MEALAAVGLASNVLQLIECGYKAVVMAKELYESKQETTQSNANATFLAQEMRELSLKITNNLPTSGLTDDEEALCRLAQQCSQLSGKLLVLLDSLRIKNRRTRLDIVLSVVRNMRKKHERDQLQASLDKCKEQFNLQLNAMSRSDITQKLECALDITSLSQQDILSLRSDVQKLLDRSSSLSVNMARFFNDLHEVVEIPLRRNAIFQNIRYPRMNDRFGNVDEAHQETFEWLLNCQEDPQNDQREEYVPNNGHGHNSSSSRIVRPTKYQKHREFVTWLQEEAEPIPANHVGRDTDSNLTQKRNIFHISGKPGAGKSTLMKFLYQNEATTGYLKTWSGKKQLIRAKAFFWRWGDDEQKNLVGLSNCLLHQILKAAPELLPILFPAEWQRDFSKPSPFELNTDGALERIFSQDLLFKKYKVIFFIDGLDEFAGRPTRLIQKIINWANSSPDNLKICVSSRQWNEFEVKFERYPKLRVHDWTRDDIRAFVTDRFEEIGKLSTSVERKDLNTLADMIVEKAEGVFLWVRVVLVSIEEGVFNADDFRDLQEKVAAFPTEIKDLYQHLLDSIPESDRRKAFEALAFTCLRNRKRSRALLQYKFLSDLSNDPNSSKKLSMEPLSEENLQKFLMNAKRQINGRCKGLLDIVPADKKKHLGDEDVTFMHSTVVEFLEQPSVRKTIKPYLSGTNIFDRILQAFIAFAKSIDTAEFYSTNVTNDKPTPALFVSELDTIIELFISDSTPGILGGSATIQKDEFLAFLDTIGQIATRRLPKRLGSDQTIPLNILIMSSRTPSLFLIHSLDINIAQNDLVKVLAVKHLVFEYFDRDGRYDLRALQVDSPSTKKFLTTFVSGVSDGFYSMRGIRMLELLFQAGISPNVLVQVSSWKDQPDDPIMYYCLWGWILDHLVFMRARMEQVSEAHIMFTEEKGFRYRLIELFLRHGAHESFTLRLGNCWQMSGSDNLYVFVCIGDSHGNPISLNPPDPVGVYVDHELDIIRYARERNGILTFRDLIAYCFPEQCQYLYALLDKKSPDSLATEKKLVRMPILFPLEHRYFESDKNGTKNYSFDARRKPTRGVQCLEHSEKCFQEFDAKLREGIGTCRWVYS